MDTTLLILIIVGITALVILSFVLLYSLSLIRRTNIVMKKIDYLVEDVTYKSESLNVAVEAINKISNYVLTFDSLTKKGFSSLTKLVSENRNYFYSLISKWKATKEQTDDKNEMTKKPKSTTKKDTTNKESTNNSLKNETLKKSDKK